MNNNCRQKVDDKNRQFHDKWTEHYCLVTRSSSGENIADEESKCKDFHSVKEREPNFSHSVHSAEHFRQAISRV